MDNLASIEEKYEKELREVKNRNRRMRFLAERNGMWILMVVLCLLGAVILGTIFAIWRSTPMWVLSVGICVTLTLGIAVFPFTIYLSVRYEKQDKELLEKLGNDPYDAETILALGNKYGIRGALNFAMKKRCQELGIDRVPEGAARDGRLPTEEEAEAIRRQMKK